MSDPLPRLRLSPLFVGSVLDEAVNMLFGSGILFSEAQRQFRKRWIEQALEATRGNQDHAAQLLGMHRNTLGRQIAELKIRALDFKRPGRYAPYPKRKSSAGQGQREVNAPVTDLHSASGEFTNSVRKGGRGESSEPSQGGSAHLALDRKPPCVDSFDLDDVECGGLKA